MARPVGSYECSITALGGSGDDVNHFFTHAKLLKTQSLNVPADSFRVPNEAGVYSGLRQWSVSVPFRFPLVPQTGHELLVTYASGYVVNPIALSVTLNSQPFDTTAGSASGALWRSFQPGVVIGNGTYTCRVDNTTPLVLPQAAATAGGAATFKLTEDGTTDNAITGNIIVNDMRVIASDNASTTVEYAFEIDGGITIVGADNFLPAGLVGQPDWDTNTDGTADVTVTGQWATSRTFSGACFWRTISIQAAIDGIIDGTLDLQGTGALTVA